MRTLLEEHERLCALASQLSLAPLPYRPAVGECCGRSCDPCVWDYYERALAGWKERTEEAVLAGQAESAA